MWIESGFPPETFWEQTPRAFQLVMKGVRKRLSSDFEERTRQAWETAAFGGAAQAGKLKPLKHYLRKQVEAQHPREMLAALMAHQSAGAKMTIRKVPLVPKQNGSGNQ